MSKSRAVAVDVASLEIRVGSLRLPLCRDDAGYSCRLDDGSLIRSVSFGARSQAVRDALADPNPSAALLIHLRAIARLDATPNTLADTVAVCLAGGAEEAPPFEVCAVEAAKRRGLDWHALEATSAIEVDRDVDGLSPQTGDSPRAGEWTNLVFETACDNDDDAMAEMIERLLARGVRPHEATRPPAEQPAGSPPGTSLRWSPHGSNGAPAEGQRELPAAAISRRPRDLRPAAWARGPAARLAEARITEAQLPEAGSVAADFISKAVAGGARGTGNPPVPAGLSEAVSAVAPSARVQGPGLLRADSGSSRVGPSTVRATTARTLAPDFQRDSGAYVPSTGPRWSPGSAEPRLAEQPRVPVPLGTVAAPVMPATNDADSLRAPLSRSADWLDAVARALADECDRRGVEA